MRAALALLALAACAAPFGASAQIMPRLPRETFDVIPPAERVRGERGDFRPYQTLCRAGPTDWARRRVVDVAVQEWAAFGFQTVDRTGVRRRLLPDAVVPPGLNPELPAPRAGEEIIRLGTGESSPRVAADIAGYWTAAPDSARALARQNRAWDGPGGEAVAWLEPWSAVFVSWVMCEAGLGEMGQFARDISHRVYIDQAIRARDRLEAGGTPEAAYVAYDAGEMPVVPGDLLCNARGAADYRSLADRRPEMDEFAPTHCDIVVKTDGAARVFLVIGGNVEQSVTLTILPGVIRDGAEMAPLSEDDLAGSRTVFAHLKLRSPDIEANAIDNTPTVRALPGLVAPPPGE